MDEALNDLALVRQTQAGRMEMFDRLMRRYEKLVCKVAMNYVKDKQSALDVTQNVFLKIYQNLGSVKNDEMFKPWMLRITYNESINWLRRRKRHEGRSEPVEEASEVFAAADQESSVLRKEAERQVLDGMERLNPKYKLAVALRYAEGMRIKEIADVMGCSEGVVKSLLFRGVRQIRNNLARPA